MKTEYKYLKFVQLESSGKTSKWNCYNLHYGEVLGQVKWNSQWRQYCYFPTMQAMYSSGCLNDIADFIEQLKSNK